MGRVGYALAGMVLWMFLGAVADAGERIRPNRLAFSNGTTLLSVAGQPGEEHQALFLIDENARTGWRSVKGKTRDSVMLFEMARHYRIDGFVIDSRENAEDRYPGSSVRSFELWTSRTSPEKGYSMAFVGKAARSQRNVFKLPTPLVCRWIKFVVLDNWGHPDYSEIMEIEAHGEPEGPGMTPQAVSGLYDIGSDRLQLIQNGRTVQGCFSGREGGLLGEEIGHFIAFQWKGPAFRTGAGAMTVAKDRRAMNALWYEDGALAGAWLGAAVGSVEDASCQLPEDGEKAMEASLEKFGRLILCGIHFDTGGAGIAPESLHVLETLYRTMRRRPDFGFIIEGHTDSSGSEAYNLALSQKRAGAVMDWLLSHGMEPERLAVEGFGEAKPIADNDTPIGRRLNRRVEIHMSK